MKNILIAIALIAFGGTFIAALVYGTGAEDRMDCQVMQIQASTTPGFWITQSQKDQCDYWKMPISAPVK